MRFESISIENFRQYSNLTFDFSKKGNNDVHLIIATNGTGKTNMLNAINWCLYGDEPHTSGTIIEGEEKIDKLPLANIRLLKECKENEDEICMVKVSIKAKDSEGKYIFTRIANVSVETEQQAGKDIFEINVIDNTGKTSICENDEANHFINEKMPQKIREYFFFDGEQLLNYFGITGTNVSHLRDSIYEIAQVNVIDKSVIENLKTFINRYVKNMKDLSPDTSPISDKIRELESNIKSKSEEIDSLQHQNVVAEEIIEKCTQLIRNTESVVEDNKRYEINKKEIRSKEDDLKTTQNELTSFIRYYLPRVMLHKINSETNEYIEMRQEESDLSPVSDIDILKKSLKEHHCMVCGEPLSRNNEIHFNELIQKYDSNSSLQKLIEIKNDIYRSLDISDYVSKKEVQFNKINKIEESINDLNNENDILFRNISTVSGLEEIEQAAEQRKWNENLRETNLEKIGKYKEQLENMKMQLSEKNEEYSKALDANNTCKEVKEKYDFVQKARELLIKVRDGIVSDITSKLEEKTMEIFESLIWKKDTYGRIELDSNFRLKLFHKHTMTSCLNSCSAAEKELLALAFTLAVHDVTGYDNLLIIDTPVGRVSDENRENFAQVLLEISKKKQIILALTPSEYSEEIKAVLNDITASSVSKLYTDETTTEMR